MKLIPNIQKELDALMADPLNYQDPRGILSRKDQRSQRRSVSDAFIVLETIDFINAERLISAYVKTERGDKLRDAYASVSKDLSEGRYKELEIESGIRTDYITPYYRRFLFCLRESINYRKALKDKATYSDFGKLFPLVSDLDTLEDDLLEYADAYRRAAIKNYQSQRDFEEALSNSAEYLQPFI